MAPVLTTLIYTFQIRSLNVDQTTNVYHSIKKNKKHNDKSRYYFKYLEKNLHGKVSVLAQIHILIINNLFNFMKIKAEIDW